MFYIKKQIDELITNIKHIKLMIIIQYRMIYNIYTIYKYIK